MTPNIPTLLMVADFENKHSDLLAAARIGKPYEPKTEVFLGSMQADFTTDTLLVKRWERCWFQYNDARALYGTAPTN